MNIDTHSASVENPMEGGEEERKEGIIKGPLSLPLKTNHVCYFGLHLYYFINIVVVVR